MDRNRTIFLNIYNSHSYNYNDYAIEMHTIKEISRGYSCDVTFLKTNENKFICIPMEIADHNKFMEAVFSNKEVWFSYIGFFMADNSFNERDERISEIIKDKNSKISFSIITSKE